MRPAASAIRTAWAVGAETATRIRAPRHDRLLDHLDRDARGERDGARGRVDPRPRQRADQLVERVVPAHVLAREQDAVARPPEARRVDRPRLVVERLPVAQLAPARTARPTGEIATPPGGRAGRGRTACARLSMPQRPQPTGPTLARRRAAMRRLGLGREPHPGLDARGPASTTSTSGRAPGAAIPSVRVKPMAKSSMSAGVAIITACVPPL